MNVTDINPFDSFAARLRVAQKRAQPLPAPKRNRSAATDRLGGRADTIGVKLAFRKRGAPRAGEPYEALAEVQRQAGTLDADGCVRLRVPADAAVLTVFVGAARRFRVSLTVCRDASNADQPAKPRIHPSNSGES